MGEREQVKTLKFLVQKARGFLGEKRGWVGKTLAVNILTALAGCSTNNVICCVAFTLVDSLCVLQPDTSNFSTGSHSYTLLPATRNSEDVKTEYLSLFPFVAFSKMICF